MDIGHLERFWHVFVYPNFTSPMAWMIWLYTAYFVLLIAEFWLLMRRDLVVARRLPGWRGLAARIAALRARDDSDESLEADMRKVKVIAAIGVPLAILFHGGVGALFGVLSSRPYWHSGLFPIIFLGRVVLGLLLLDALFQFSEILVGVYGSEPGYVASLQLALQGPYWYVFWIGQVGIGLALPIAILATRLGRDPRFVTLACAAVVLGFIGVRLNIVIPGMAVEEIAGLVRAVDDPRYMSDYFPSGFEGLVSFGVGGFGLILFGIGEVFLPLSQRLVVPAPARGTFPIQPAGPAMRPGP